MTSYEIELEAPASDAHATELHERLASTGQALRADQMQTFLLRVTARDGSMTAGCKGEIAFTSAHVFELWVDERSRGQGLGRMLLRAAESHANDQGCTRIHLETRNDRARELYEELGYTIFGVLERYEGENSFYYLEKKIG